MTDITYLDFDLLIERSDTLYRVRVLHSPCGQAASEFGRHVSDELNDCWEGIRRSRGQRHIHSQELAEIKEFGARLFGVVFAGKVETSLFRSLDEAKRQDKRLRLQLRLGDVPELASLPWEYLYSESLGFLVLSAEISLVHYLELPAPITPLAVKPPLKVLVMICNPGDYDELDVEREWTRLENALKELKARGLISLERLDAATLPALHQKLRQNDYHVFHFIGHGDFDERTKDGSLLFETENRQGHPVSALHLGTVLRGKHSLRLVVLNACKGAIASRTDTFAGVAQNLVQQGIPAVIGMQLEISDRAAITFSQEFYSSIADGSSLEAALYEARQAIFTKEEEIEWGTPVLYMRAPDGRIFDLLTDKQKTPTMDSVWQKLGKIWHVIGRVGPVLGGIVAIVSIVATLLTIPHIQALVWPSPTPTVTSLPATMPATGTPSPVVTTPPPTWTPTPTPTNTSLPSSTPTTSVTVPVTTTRAPTWTPTPPPTRTPTPTPTRTPTPKLGPTTVIPPCPRGPVGSGSLTAVRDFTGNCVVRVENRPTGDVTLWEADFYISVHGGNAGYTISSPACRWDCTEQKFVCHWSAQEGSSVVQTVMVSCPGCSPVTVPIDQSAEFHRNTCTIP